MPHWPLLAAGQATPPPLAAGGLSSLVLSLFRSFLFFIVLLDSMSAYGAIARPATNSSSPLSPTSYLLPTQQALTVFPLTRAVVDPALVAYLTSVFNDVVREGRTYPQKDELTEDEFVRAFPPPAPRAPSAAR